jgi:L-ribulose-5-phosphate 3-epimerase UlaE
MLFGEGDTDNSGFFKELENVGFDGAVLLELYREESPDFIDRLCDNAKKLDFYLKNRKYAEGK